MKTIIRFIIMLWKLFTGLFRKPVPVTKRIETAREEAIQATRQRIIPPHNNRATHKGRLVQYVNMGGYTRAIYHAGGGKKRVTNN